MSLEIRMILPPTYARGNMLGRDFYRRARVRAGYFEPALAVQSLLKSADGAGLYRADPAQEAEVAVAALQASAQGERCPGMNTTYTVNLIQKGLTLLLQRTFLPHPRRRHLH